MSKIKMIIYIGGIFLIVVLIIMSKLYRSNRLLYDINQILTEKIEFMNNYKTTAFIRMKEFNSNHKQISPKTELIDEQGKPVLLENIVDTNTLIFRYTETHCIQCVEEQICILKDTFNIQHNHMILLTTCTHKRSIQVFKNLYNIPYRIYNLKEPLSLEAEEVNLPYFFILDKECMVDDVLITQKEFPLYTKRYLEIIKDNY